MKQSDELGTPEVLVVPNAFHRSDAAIFKEKYPAVLVACPAVSHNRVARLVAVDSACQDILLPLGVTCHAPEGVKPFESVYEFHLKSGRACMHRPAD